MTTAAEHPWHLRNRFDEGVKRDVVDNDEYRLPADMTGQLVLDLGGNIGTFARVVAERGARVWTVEPDLESLDLAKKNCAHLGEVRYFWGAVADHEGSMAFTRCTDPAGSNLFGKGAARGAPSTVPVYTLGNLIRSMLAQEKREAVDLVKLDVEGAEYLCLPCPELALCRRALVEFHDGYVPDARRKADELRAWLGTLFDEQRWEQAHQNMGWFMLYSGQRKGEASCSAG